MKYPLQLFKAIISLFIAFVLSACSDSASDEEVQLNLVSQVSFPFFDNFTLYNFAPETGEKELLAQSNNKLMITLDTDESFPDKDEDNNTVFIHSVLPEFVLYVKDQALHLFDLHTRHDHNLINFTIDNLTKADAQRAAQILAQQAEEAETALDAEEFLARRDKVLSEASDKQICDLRKSIILDEEGRLAGQTIFKDEQLAYIKVIPIEQNCSDLNTDTEYFKVNIEDSRKDTFEIRRNTLEEHDHLSKHLHKHEDDSVNDGLDIHDHDHNFANGEIDDNGDIFDINNHTHSHVITHDFLYVDLDEHKHLSQEELAQVHDDSDNQEEKTEEHPVLVGKKITVDQTLMYAGQPIVDIENKQYGYLGFNDKESSYTFHGIDTETLEKIFLWKMESAEFSLKRPALSTISNINLLKPLQNKFNRYSTLLNDGILLEFNDKAVKLNLVDLFDDDLDVERTFSVDNPIFEFTHDESNTPEIIYNSASDQIVFHDMNKIFIVNNTTSGSPRLIRKIEDPNIVKFSLTSLLGENIVVSKQNSAPGSRSITQISIQSGQEQTLQASNNNFFTVTSLTNSLSFTNEVLSNQNWQTQYFSESLIPLYTPPLTDVIWAKGTNYQITSNVEAEIFLSLFQSFSVSLPSNSSSTLTPRLTNPSLRKFDIDTSGGSGSLIGVVPSEIAISGIEKVTILNKFYGFIEVKSDREPNTPTQVYFFPPEISSINPTGEFGDMKLMFEVTPE